MFRKHITERSRRIFLIFVHAFIALLFLATLAGAQSVQTTDSEAQLASMLCRNPKEEATKELLNKNQQLVNIALWNALLDCASSAQRKGSPANSIEIYKLTLRVADQLKKPELVAATQYYLGRTYSGMSDFENAIHAYETSRKSFEEAGNERNLIYVLADLGALYFNAEDYDEAQSYSEQSLAIAERLEASRIQERPIEYGRARSLHTSGEIDLYRGNYNEALNKLRGALALCESLNETGSSYNTLTSEVLASLARLHGEIGNYGQAFSYLNKAQPLARSSGDQNAIANVMNVLGFLFLEQEDYAPARKYFNASLATYRSSNTRQEARVLLNLAEIEERQGHDDEARRLFQRTLDAATTAKLVNLQIGAGEGMGVVLTAERDFPNALQAINQSLELARRTNSKTREAELLWRAAQTYYAMEEYQESGVLAEQALALAHSLRLRKLTYFATATLGEAYAADNRSELAVATLKEAINQVEEMRDRVAGRQEGRHLFFENKVGPYQTLVKLLTREGKNFEALLYAERAKGRVLLEAVRNNGSDLKNLYTDGEKAEADLLINKLHAINQRIQSQPGGEPKDELQNELNGVRRELVLFQQRLTAAHPELLLRAGPAKLLMQADLDSLIPASDFAYLEYVVTGDHIGIFIVKRKAFTTDHDLKYVNLTVNTDELRRKVNEFHSALAERQPDYISLGRELYRLLVEPVTNELQNISTVCIIPDEFLWTLPFQALTNTRGNYLIQDYSLFYAPSLSVLKELTLRTRQRSSKESLIAFGNPVIERDDKLKQNLHSLPEAEAEVAAVAAAVPTQMKKVLVGVQAEEKTFKALAPQYATIHLATHGLLDNTEPLNSYLLLTRTDGDPANDGLLRAREIIDMQLDADLAVLSACETGNGRISPGEGVIGMSWAFLVAGARSVVVSQWRVNSSSTSQLMKNFYQAMTMKNELNGRNKSQALRDASLRLLKDRRYIHPFYWAGFVLVSSN